MGARSRRWGGQPATKLDYDPGGNPRSEAILLAVGRTLPRARSRQSSLADLYGHLPVVDFSRDILESELHGRLRVLPVAACGWTDLGTPRRVAETVQRLSDGHRQGATVAGEFAQLTLAGRNVARPSVEEPRSNRRGLADSLGGRPAADARVDESIS